MSKVTIGLPFAPTQGVARQYSRTFTTNLPLGKGMSGPLARVIRDHLDTPAGSALRSYYSTLPDERLVEQDDLILAIPDAIWQQNGFNPLGGWKATSAEGGK